MAENDMRKYYVFAVKAMTDILGTILVPAILALILRYAYNDLVYEELIFFISLGVVFILSMVTVVKKVQRYGKEYKQLINSQPPSPGSSSSS